jgi:4-diphosphocytidyl-2-C-methyl-D-erythritol kinase
MRVTAEARSRVVVVAAPAKVNLVLRVLEREPSGYHRLETYFQMLELADRVRVEVTPAEGIEIEVTGADVGPAQENLALRAARAYLQATGLRIGLRIDLEKRIPAGAGLGGGSSDAAATLRALDAVLGALPPERLLAVAAWLGSDVPFFLCGSALALGRGRGEALSAMPSLPPAPVIVAFPGVHVSTAAAYQAIDRSREAGAGRPAATGSANVKPLGADLPDWSAVERLAHNDFEALICETHPEVARARAALQRTSPRFALLSGSGSALFAVYRDAAAANAALKMLQLESAADHRLTRTATSVPAPELGR